MSRIRRGSDARYEDLTLVEPDVWVPNTGSHLRELLKRNPHLKLPGDLLDKIAAFDRARETQLNADRIVEEVMKVGLKSESGSLSREQIVFGLDMMNFFFAKGELRGLVRELRLDLMQLDLGVVPPILRPVRSKNRPPDSRFVRLVKIEAATVCESLIRRGATQRRAAEKVAYVLNKHKMTLQPGGIAAKTVLQWRRTFKDKIMWLWLPCVIPHWRQSATALADFEVIVKAWSADRSVLLSE
jgi:hypothetical protein